MRQRPYQLRLLRYEVLAQDVNEAAGLAQHLGRPLRVLIVGCGGGNELRFLRRQSNFDNIVLSGANAEDDYLQYLDLRQEREFYQEIFVGDLMEGYPKISSDAYDIVICEQVLEHLVRLPTAIATLARVAKPGGTVVIGVPIFPPPLHFVRKTVVPALDVWLRRRKKRGHVQAFSLGSLVREVRNNSNLRLIRARGFRVVSGGPLRPLENYIWWWRINRWLGALVPSLCIEVQTIWEKPTAAEVQGPGKP